MIRIEELDRRNARPQPLRYFLSYEEALKRIGKPRSAMA
jgi:hypothetical protein